MTLFKQIAFVVSLVFLLAIFIITMEDFRRSGENLEGQLQTSAQNMATTLGIAISNSTTLNDVAAYETLFNAVFDSGYYSSIELVDPDGKTILKKVRVLEVNDVPDWFIKAVPLWPATGKTDVMQGWVQLGTLKLTLHPGFAYAGLYEGLKATAFWILLSFTVAMVLLWLLIHWLLEPLSLVKQQAEAIHDNQFVQQEKLPKTIELRSVVIAMNRMVGKVQHIFDDQAATLSQYQKLLYEDPVTGIGNRAYLMDLLQRTQAEDISFHGSLAVIKIHNLEMVREMAGYTAVEKILLEVANNIHNIDIGVTHLDCARLSDDEFAILITEGSHELVEKIETLYTQFQSAIIKFDQCDSVYLTTGITEVQAGRHVGETLGDSDFALSQAAAKGAFSICEKKSSDIILPQGKIQWRSWLEECIASDRLFLVRQNVLNLNGDVIHQEIFLRLKNAEGQVVPAGMFMPMASSLGLGDNIDRAVFSLVKQAGEVNNPFPIALNLTPSVFSDADALIEFNNLVRYFKHSSVQLCVEASHAILEQYPQICAEVAEVMKKAGQSFGIDNLNLSRSLKNLQIVRPDYIKVNARTLFNLTNGEISGAYQALNTMAKTMDIRLIAVAVDTQELYDHLKALGITTMQGNLLGLPEEFL